MANNVLLISEKQIKEKSILEINIDSKILNRTIIDVQELQLKSILGTDLYNSVIDSVASAANTSYVIPDNIKELLKDYITPFLIYAVIVDIIISNNYKLTNKGVLKLNDNNASNLTSDELEYQKNYADNKANAYKQRLIQYLSDNNYIDNSSNTDTDVSFDTIGWAIPTSSYPTIENLSTASKDFVNETDPVWNAEKNNYYTQSEIDDLLNDKENSLGFTPVPDTRAVNSKQLTSDITLNKTDIGLSNVDNTSDLNKPISTATQTALNSKADLVGGIIPTSQVPAVTISDFLGSVASQSAMLALTGQRGDWCIRTDESRTYVLIADTPSNLSSWKFIENPSSPVTSVNGQVGVIVLGASDIGLGNVNNTSDINKPISTATQTALNSKENSIAAGTTSQYWRGDKSFQTLDKTAVGLSNVVNIDTTNASNISSGTLADSRLSSSVILSTNSYSNPSWLTDLIWSKITSTPTTLSGYGITGGNLTGTTGNGYLGLLSQGANPIPTPPSNGVNIFTTSLGRISWKVNSGAIFSLIPSGSGNVVYNLPTGGGTQQIPSWSMANTFSNNNTFNSSSTFNSSISISTNNTTNYLSLDTSGLNSPAILSFDDDANGIVATKQWVNTQSFHGIDDVLAENQVLTSDRTIDGDNHSIIIFSNNTGIDFNGNHITSIGDTRNQVNGTVFSVDDALQTANFYGFNGLTINGSYPFPFRAITTADEPFDVLPGINYYVDLSNLSQNRDITFTKMNHDGDVTRFFIIAGTTTFAYTMGDGPVNSIGTSKTSIGNDDSGTIITVFNVGGGTLLYTTQNW